MNTKSMRRLVFIFPMACCCIATSCTDPNAKLPTDTRWQRYTKKRERPTLEVELPSHDVFGLVVAVSPDFTRLAYSSLFASNAKSPIIVADFKTAKTHVTLDGHTGSTQCLAFSHDGKRLVSGGAKGEVIVWDVTAGAHRRVRHIE